MIRASPARPISSTSAWIAGEAEVVAAGDNAEVVVIGIGNDRRGDDGVGPAVARKLKGKLAPQVRVVEHDGEVAGLVELLGAAKAAVLVDAALSGAHPGKVHRLDAAAGPLPPAMFAWSTHALGLAEAVELARALGRLPDICQVCAIEAQNFETDQPLSPPVAAAVLEVAETIREEIARIENRAPETSSHA